MYTGTNIPVWTKFEIIQSTVVEMLIKNHSNPEM